MPEVNKETMEMEKITGFEGEWLVLLKGEVIASSDNAEKMLKYAEQFPAEDVTVTKVLFANASFY